MSPPLLVDHPAPGLARLTLNAPERRNAIDASLRTALLSAAQDALEESAIRALVIAGGGGHFSAGGDLASMEGLTLEAGRARMKAVHAVLRLLLLAEKPVIAAVQGYAVGAGAGLALATDAIVAGESARFAFPFFRVGLTPDWGVLHTLPRRIGPARARGLIATGRRVEATEALTMGLADEVVPDAELAARTLTLAAEMARLPPMAFAMTKRQLADPAASLDAALEAEALAQAACFTSADAAEGRRAFFEKRAPRFGKR